MNGNIRNLRIGDLLKERGLVTEEQIGEALAYQKEHRGVRLGDALVELGLIAETQMLETLANQLQVQVVDISTEDVELEAVERIPRELSEKYLMLGIKKRENVLSVAMNDPLNFYGLEDVRQVTGMTIDICLCTKAELSSAINFYYSEVEARAAANIANENFEQLAAEGEFDVEEGDDDETPVINLLNRLIDRAYATHTSDIHIEPFEHKTVVRMRIDGVIVEFVELQKNIHSPLIARIKILGGMDIAERRIPQDGHFRIKVDKEFVNLRVNVIPTVFGEKAVLRLLANNSPIDYPETFGMQRADYVKLSKMLGSPNGIIYFTGPTGSGKTTTLYMILTEISKRPVNISTIEDPVEKSLPKINQTQVNNQAGLTFESGLRALLRQDPDVIMVGETRDMETAMISARSAMTGHLVFSTLHTNDAASSVIRLADMGLMPYMIANSLVGVIAQRLMRKVCPDCCEERHVDEEESFMLGGWKGMVKTPKGCPQCNYTGYRGRIAIHEVLMVDKQVRTLIMEGATAETIQEYAVEHQDMRTLKAAGVEMVKEGVTSMEELKKVAYYG